MAKSRRPPRKDARRSPRRKGAIRRAPRTSEAGLRAENAQLREQQAATGEILRVISSSPTDLQPVFDTIASSATRLCDASFCIVFRFDGEMITVAADDGRSPGTLDVIRSAYPSRPGRQSISARTIFERRVISIPDAQNMADYPQQAERARAIGYRSVLAVPMLRGDVAIGTINVARLEAIPFTDTQVELLKTFADQAVIAIENATAQHLLSLINDILDLSKIEAGRMELEVVEFDLPTAVDNALTLVRERAGRRGIALERVVDERLGAIRGDERKTKQVLLNLLSNALKFTPEGGRVDVRAGVMDDFAEIAVSDTGIGIAPEYHDAVFEEFRQVGSSDKKAEGTGLGLLLSRKFIELHGGRIWVKSAIGAGSTFIFTLPLKTA